MENENPIKRQSLLPQRSASMTHTVKVEDKSSKLAPPRPKHRDISPSKLPIGGLSRTLSTRLVNPPARVASTRKLDHKPQKSCGSIARGDLAVAIPIRTASAAPNSVAREFTARKPSVLSRDAKVVATEEGARAPGPERPATGHRPTFSTSSAQSRLTPLVRPTSSGQAPKDAENKTTQVSHTKTPSTSTRANLANVKIQRPSSGTHVRPPSPKKATTKTLPVLGTNKFALLTTPVPPALKATQDLKLELLHLHMLHRESASTKAQWSASAKTHYGKQFDRLIALESELRTSELDFIEQRNAAALIAWCRTTSATTAESKTKVLSGILDEMWMLVAPGGRYTAAVGAFEDWFALSETMGSTVGSSHRDTHIDVNVMEGLGDGWKSEVDALMGSLCRMSDEVDGLGPAEPEAEGQQASDLARVLNVLMTMMANMLEELVMVRDIEGKIVEREGTWVKGRIEGLGMKVSGER